MVGLNFVQSSAGRSRGYTGRVRVCTPICKGGLLGSQLSTVTVATVAAVQIATTGAPGRGDADLDAIYCIYAALARLSPLSSLFHNPPLLPFSSLCARGWDGTRRRRKNRIEWNRHRRTHAVQRGWVPLYHWLRVTVPRVVGHPFPVHIPPKHQVSWQCRANIFNKFDPCKPPYILNTQGKHTSLITPLYSIPNINALSFMDMEI